MIDDVTTQNYFGEFEQSFEKIYSELLLRQKTVSNNEGLFFHIYVKCGNNQISIQPYHKRDDCCFSVARMLYLRSNIPSTMFCFAYKSEILTTRTTNSRLIFSNTAKWKLTRMCKQAGRIKAFPHALAKMYGRHFQTLVYVLRLKKRKEKKK